jgi:DNA-binding NarL/FixJ family response regulator
VDKVIHSKKRRIKSPYSRPGENVRIDISRLRGERKAPPAVTRDVRRTAVILDDHPLWLSALELVLGEADVDVVGAATSGESAMAQLEEKRPDLFVADLHLKTGGSGIACIQEAINRFPATSVIIVSAFDDPASVDDALSTGAAAFISKAAGADEIASAVRQVFSHSVFLASRHRIRAQRLRRQSDRLPGLTRREAEILDLVAEGHSNAQVATMLWVTEQTVKFHLSNIYRKLGVSNRTEASHWALVQELRAGTGDEPAAVGGTG